MCSGRSGGTRRVTRSTAPSTEGTGRNESAGIPPAHREGPPGRPRRGEHGGGGHSGPLARHLPLDEEIGAPEAAAVVVEQVAQQGRGGTEGKRADRPERLAWHGVAERVAADDRDVGQAPPPRLASQLFRPVRVALERDDIDAAPGERERARAAPGADLDDEIGGLEGRLGDQDVGEVRPEEVLTETAPSLVPRCPLARGHGRPWSCSWGPLCPGPRTAAPRSSGWGTGPPVAPLAALGALDLALHVGPHQRIGVLGRRSRLARVMITNATVQSTAMVLSLARKPANSWSRRGDRPATVPGWVKVGYSECRAKIQTMERKLGTIDCTMR